MSSCLARLGTPGAEEIVGGRPATCAAFTPGNVADRRDEHALPLAIPLLLVR